MQKLINSPFPNKGRAGAACYQICEEACESGIVWNTLSREWNKLVRQAHVSHLPTGRWWNRRSTETLSPSRQDGKSQPLRVSVSHKLPHHIFAFHPCFNHNKGTCLGIRHNIVQVPFRNHLAAWVREGKRNEKNRIVWRGNTSNS